MLTKKEIDEKYIENNFQTGEIKDAIKAECNGFDESFDGSLFIGYIKGFAVVINCSNLTIIKEA